MSTTVTYKGSTIATAENQTKTLLTEGKYLEDDITIVDVTSGGSSTLITKNISANGTYNASSDSADGYSQVTVAVPASAVDTGTKSISTNGTHDVVGYASASVAVPNSYSAGDEGKVVSNGALVAQTSDTVTENDTYDTTLINSLTVNVSGGGGALYPLVNGTHTFLGGQTVTVTNGNHVEIVVPTGSTGAGIVNLSDVTENGNTFTATSNVQNKSKKFTIPADGIAIFYVYNYSDPNRGMNLNVYGTGTSNLGMAVSKNAGVENGYTAKTFTTAADVGCLFFANGLTAGTYSFDVLFIVNGEIYVG